MSQSKKDDLKKHNAWIVKAIETQIIPRLILAHQSKNEANASSNEDSFKEKSSASLNANSIERFTKFLLENDVQVCKAYVETLLEEGISIEDIYLKLITPAAYKLGYFWEEDLADFTAVTIAMWKIQQVLYQFSDKFLNSDEENNNRHRILLIPAPGSQHTLGLFMLSEFFRKNGWYVHGEPSISEKDASNLIKTNDFHIVGISIGAIDLKENTRKLIKKIRQSNSKQNLKIMVGGPAIINRTTFYKDVGADAQASDASDAILVANKLVGCK
jgi:methanogenic corrinoid protein MtbC1